MSTYIYGEEKIADIWDELTPLLEEHWSEIAMYQDEVKLNVNKDFYERGQGAGSILFVSARLADEASPDFSNLVGYCATFLSHHPHYSDHVYAVNDVFFVAPDHREGTGVAYTLVTTTEAIAKERGASVMTYHMKEHGLFEKLMEGAGFEQFERLYSKYIGT